MRGNFRSHCVWKKSPTTLNRRCCVLRNVSSIKSVGDIQRFHQPSLQLAEQVALNLSKKFCFKCHPLSCHVTHIAEFLLRECTHQCASKSLEICIICIYIYTYTHWTCIYTYVSKYCACVKHNRSHYIPIELIIGGDHDETIGLFQQVSSPSDIRSMTPSLSPAWSSCCCTGPWKTHRNPPVFAS